MYTYIYIYRERERRRERERYKLFVCFMFVYNAHYPKFHPPPPLSRHRYDIFSGAVHIKLPYEALTIFHTAGSVVGVGVEIMVLKCYLFILCLCIIIRC